MHSILIFCFSCVIIIIDTWQAAIMAAKRNAYRGVVKKRIQELDTILAEEEPDLTRLKQLRLLFLKR